MIFKIKESKIRSTYFNLAMEEAISLRLVQNDWIGGIRFYENKNSIVLGISDFIESNVQTPILNSFKDEFEKNKNPLKSKDIPFNLQISRRASGGGTVYQDVPGNLNYSIFINLKKRPDLFPIQNSYNQISTIPIQALKSQNFPVELAGKSDLSISINEEMLKISGNSQFRKRDCLVHHGTLILSNELISKVSEFLLHPPAEPDYRKGRTHSKFITSIPKTFSIDKFKMDMTIALQNFLGDQFGHIPLKEFRELYKSTKELMTQKYLNKDFIFSR
jgi:lipoate---protein ligase